MWIDGSDFQFLITYNLCLAEAKKYSVLFCKDSLSQMQQEPILRWQFF